MDGVLEMNNFITTGGFEYVSGEFEYIFNNRLGLETVLALPRFVSPQPNLLVLLSNVSAAMLLGYTVLTHTCMCVCMGGSTPGAGAKHVSICPFNVAYNLSFILFD